MVIDTLTFSDKSEGWTSKWTYRPEWMIGLNNTFYTFKGGNLFQHDTNTQRTVFYGDTAYYSISTIINQSPTEIKMFKTLALDSTLALDITGYTDLDQMEMDISQFVNKEGEWYSYIRRPINQLNYDLVSTQGVGIASSVTGTNTILIDGEIDNINQGDLIYKANYNTATSEISNVLLVGTVVSISGSTIVTTSFTNAPVGGNYILAAKQSSVESYGSRGYFLDLTLSRSGSEAQIDNELFAVSTSVFKSFP
jgi:hypothetical protein